MSASPESAQAAETLAEFKRRAAELGVNIIDGSERVYTDGWISIDTKESATPVTYTMRAAGHKISSGHSWNVWRVLIMPS